MTKGVILLSGGINSAVVAYQAAQECSELNALTFRYGQPSENMEIQKAINLGYYIKFYYHNVHYLLLAAVTGKPKFNGIEYVPHRNALFLTMAHAWAEAIGADRIYTGINGLYCPYPDSDKPYLDVLRQILALGSIKAKAPRDVDQIKFCHPLLAVVKADIISMGRELGVPFKETWSCATSETTPCGSCPPCKVRWQGFEKMGVIDPLRSVV